MNERAGVRVEVVSGPNASADECELQAGRRVVKLLRSLIGSERLVELLSSEIETSNAMWKEMLAASDGRWTPSSIDLTVTGMTAEDFLARWESSIRNPETVYAATPEHLLAGRDGTTGWGIEYLGGRVSRQAVRHLDDSEAESDETSATAERLPDYPLQMVLHGVLDDGTVCSHGRHQFRPRDGGFDAKFTIYFPSACPADVIDEHQQHLLVEWKNWIEMAGAAAA